jgi:hypothetical protein
VLAPVQHRPGHLARVGLQRVRLVAPVGQEAEQLWEEESFGFSKKRI